jgi:hypothetical protein
MNAAQSAGIGLTLSSAMSEWDSATTVASFSGRR